MPAPPVLHLFDAFGIELEYMIVDARTLDVRPITDELFKAVTGSYVCDVEEGPIAWSNELALHVVELKTNGPAPSLGPLSSQFADNVRAINELLARFGCRLLPTAMHPWMDPHRELKLWPHDYSPIYESYNRIFDCTGHGWANLQSTHINLPFADDAEFARLHAAIRLALPILPGLAASSPVMDGRLTGLLDNRLEVYRGNARRVPSVTGRVIPERVFSRREYEESILAPMYADIAPLDPAGVLQDEFLNSRGAIARFCRNTIEIRLIDVQECPLADLAVSSLVIGLLKLLTSEYWTDCRSQQAVEIEPLEAILLNAIRDADQAQISDAPYLKLFGVDNTTITIGDLWRYIASEIEAFSRGSTEEGAASGFQSNDLRTAVKIILNSGPLALRIAASLGNEPSREQLREVYQRLADCLSRNEVYAIEN